MRIKLKFWIAIVAVVWLPGCLTPAAYVPVERFDVVPEVTVDRHEATSHVLAVRGLTAPQHYKTPMVYRESEFEVFYRFNEEWAELPRDMVTRALRDSLSATGYFADVGDASALSAPSLVLTGELRRFDELRGESPWAALCEVRIEVRESGLPGTAVWAKTYRELESMTGESASALAEAMTTAVSRAVASATDDIVSAIAASEGVE